MYSLAEIDKISPNDDTLKRQFVEIFVRDMPDNIESLGMFWSNNQLKELAQLAHKMTPTIKMLGNAQLANSMNTIESKAKQNTTDGLENLVPSVKNELTNIFHQIKVDFNV